MSGMTKLQCETRQQIAEDKEFARYMQSVTGSYENRQVDMSSPKCRSYSSVKATSSYRCPCALFALLRLLLQLLHVLVRIQTCCFAFHGPAAFGEWHNRNQGTFFHLVFGDLLPIWKQTKEKSVPCTTNIVTDLVLAVLGKFISVCIYAFLQLVNEILTFVLEVVLHIWVVCLAQKACISMKTKLE